MTRIYNEHTSKKMQTGCDHLQLMVDQSGFCIYYDKLACGEFILSQPSPPTDVQLVADHLEGVPWNQWKPPPQPATFNNSTIVCDSIIQPTTDADQP